MNSRHLFLVGTIVWFLTAIGHPVLVDIDLVLGLHSPIGPEVRPDADLRQVLGSGLEKSRGGERGTLDKLEFR